MGERQQDESDEAQGRPVAVPVVAATGQAPGSNDADPALRKSEISRRRILDAAARVFRERGYAGTRLTDIAAEANMQTGSLYYHFDSREALVEEVMHVGLARAVSFVSERLDALPASADPLTRLAAAIEAHLLAVLSVSDYSSATIRLLGHVPPPIRERHLVGNREYGRVWAGLLQDARDAGQLREDVDLSAARMLILGALNWSTEWYRSEPGGQSAEKIARDAVALLLEGLAVGSGRRRVRRLLAD